jgi:hypothetical protein
VTSPGHPTHTSARAPGRGALSGWLGRRELGRGLQVEIASTTTEPPQVHPERRRRRGTFAIGLSLIALAGFGIRLGFALAGGGKGTSYDGVPALPSVVGLDTLLAHQVFSCVVGAAAVVLVGVATGVIAGARVAWIAAGRTHRRVSGRPVRLLRAAPIRGCRSSVPPQSSGADLAPALVPGRRHESPSRSGMGTSVPSDR